MTDLLDRLFAEFAEERARLHAEHASSRPLSDGYELVGLKGEAEFQRVFNVPMDLNPRSGGDAGVDFVVPLRTTVDVKCARKAFNLIQEQGKVGGADIYVLAQYHDETQHAELLGWAWKAELLRAPVRDFGKGIVNHFIERQDLRSIASLHDRIMRFA